MEYVKLAIVGLIVLAVRDVLEKRLPERRERLAILVVVAVLLSAAFHVAGF